MLRFISDSHILPKKERGSTSIWLGSIPMQFSLPFNFIEPQIVRWNSEAMADMARLTAFVRTNTPTARSGVAAKIRS